MPMAPTRRGRIQQVANWLRDEFPTPYPVTVRVRDLNGGKWKGGGGWTEGTTDLVGRRIVVCVDSSLRWVQAIDCLLHEWAHAATLRHSTVECDRASHDAEWGIRYAAIYTAFHNAGRATYAYPERPSA